MSYYNEYAVIPTRTPTNELYHTLNQIPRSRYMGSQGDECYTTMDCHQPFKCVETTQDQNPSIRQPSIRRCDDWIPYANNIIPDNGPNREILYSSPRVERFTSLPGVDFLALSPDYEDFPITTKVSKELQYNSSYKANSGKNYW